MEHGRKNRTGWAPRINEFVDLLGLVCDLSVSFTDMDCLQANKPSQFGVILGRESIFQTFAAFVGHGDGGVVKKRLCDRLKGFMGEVRYQTYIEK